MFVVLFFLWVFAGLVVLSFFAGFGLFFSFISFPLVLMVVRTTHIPTSTSAAVVSLLTYNCRHDGR